MPSQQTEVETEKTTLMRKELLRVPELQTEQPEVLERLLLLWQNVQVGCSSLVDIVLDYHLNLDLARHSHSSFQFRA